MDPDAALEALRKLSADESALRSPEAAYEALAAMQVLFEGLDGWLSKSGFLPTAWRR